MSAVGRYSGLIIYFTIAKIILTGTLLCEWFSLPFQKGSEPGLEANQKIRS